MISSSLSYEKPSFRNYSRRPRMGDWYFQLLCNPHQIGQRRGLATGDRTSRSRGIRQEKRYRQLRRL